MANFNDTTLSKSSFKLLQNKAHTSNAKESYNELESTTLTLGSQEVFGSELPFDPVAAVSQGLAAHVILNLVSDPSSAGNGYLATIITVSGTGLDGYINPRTGIAYANGDRVGYIIPPKFDEPPPPPPGPPPTQSYRAILKNNGIEVPPSDASNWYLDYRSGVVVSETNLSLVNGTLDGYVYIGELLSDRLDAFESSGITWVVDGSDIRNTNSGNILPDIDLGASLGDATNRWSSLNIGPSSLHIRTISSESGGTARDWNQHIDLPSGNLIISEAANDYFAIKTTGQIGIGTTIPIEKLTISSNGNDALALNATTTNDPLIRFKLSDTGTFTIGIDNSDDDKFKISRGSFLGTNDDLVIKQTDGYVGVNVATPTQKLHVNGNIRMGVGGSQTIVGDVHMAVATELNLLLVGYSNLTSGFPGAGFGDIIFGMGSNSVSQSAQFSDMFPASVPRVEYARISGSTGNVGIGITNPTQKFQVGPSIVADSSNIRVGIGTHSPADSLHVFKTVASGKVAMLVENTSNSANANAALDLKANTTDGSLSVFEDSHVDGAFMQLAAADVGMHIRFDTEGSEKVRIESDGKVGIGVTNPSQRLQVVSSFVVDSTNTRVGIGTLTPAFPLQIVQTVNSNSTLEIKNTTNGTAAYAQTSVTNNVGSIEVQAISSGYTTSGLTIAGSGRLHTSSGITAGLVISTDAAAPVIFGTGNAERMRIDSNGDVGIGTSNPLSKFNVYGSGSALAWIQHTGTASSVAGAYLTLASSTDVSSTFTPSGTRLGVINFDGNNDGSPSTGASIQAYADAAWDGFPNPDSQPTKISFFTVPTSSETLAERMVIKSSGNIGIGTTNPSSKLHIAGTSGLKIDTTGAQWAVLGSSTAATSYMTLLRGGSVAALGYIGGGAGGAISGGTANDLVIRSEADLMFAAGGDTERFRISNTGDALLTTSAGVFRFESETATAYLSGNATSVGIFDTLGNFAQVDGTRLSFNSENNVYFYTNGTADVIMTLDAAAEAVAIGVTGAQVEKFDVRGLQTGTDTIDDFIAQIVNTDNQSSGHAVLHLGMAETTTSTTDRFLVCTSDTTGAVLGTVEFYINGQGGTGTSLTSQHWVVLDSENIWLPGESLKTGMILSSTGIPWISRDEQTGIPCVSISSVKNDKKVFGVLSSDFDEAYDLKMWEHFQGVFNDSCRSSGVKDNCRYSEGSQFFKARANSGGEGRIWVSNIYGDIQNGDFITSSDIPGYGSLQDDDLLHSYTVAKCTQNIDWNNINDYVVYNGTSFKVCLVICTYHCG